MTSHGKTLKNELHISIEDTSSYAYSPGARSSYWVGSIAATHADIISSVSKEERYHSQKLAHQTIQSSPQSLSQTGSLLAIQDSSLHHSISSATEVFQTYLHRKTMLTEDLSVVAGNVSQIVISKDNFLSNETTMAANTTSTIITPSLVSLNYSTPVMVIITVILLTMTILTAFGNLLVGIALIKFKTLRSVSNFLIGNLALSDFLLATTILPLSSMNEAFGHWVFGRNACYFWLCVDVLYCTASIWNLCIIAMDRCFATVLPIWYRDRSKGLWVCGYICFIWIIGFSISIPPLLGWNEITKSYIYIDNSYYQCILFDNRSYVIYSATGSFYLPFCITFILYLIIFYFLRRRIRKMRSPQNRQNRPSRRTSRSQKKRNTSRTAAAIAQTTMMNLNELEQALIDKNSQKNSEPCDNFTLQVPPVEFEMTTTGMTDNQESGNSGNTESLFGSGSTHSGDDDNDSQEHRKEMRGGGGDSTPIYMSSDTEAKQHLMQNGFKKYKRGGDSLKKNRKRGATTPTTPTAPHTDEVEDVQTLVICNPNHWPLPSDSKVHKNNVFAPAVLEISPQVQMGSSDNISNDDKVKTMVTSAPQTNGKNSLGSNMSKSIETKVIPTIINHDETITSCPLNNNHVPKSSSILSFLRRSPRLKRKQNQRKKNRRQDRETKATIRMAIIIVVFLVSWLGFFTHYLLRGIMGEKANIPHFLESILFWMGYGNSAINPILYTIFNDDFRRAFVRILGCHKRKNQGHI